MLQSFKYVKSTEKLLFSRVYNLATFRAILMSVTKMPVPGTKAQSQIFS